MNTMADDNASQDAVQIERTLDAPADLIWQMWTQPEHFKAWYGPEGATIVVARMDVRVGGRLLVGMEIATPNSTMRMWFTGEYREVVENKRLVYTRCSTPTSTATRLRDSAPAHCPCPRSATTRVCTTRTRRHHDRREPQRQVTTGST